MAKRVSQRTHRQLKTRTYYGPCFLTAALQWRVSLESRHSFPTAVRPLTAHTDRGAIFGLSTRTQARKSISGCVRRVCAHSAAEPPLLTSSCTTYPLSATADHVDFCFFSHFASNVLTRSNDNDPLETFLLLRISSIFLPTRTRSVCHRLMNYALLSIFFRRFCLLNHLVSWRSSAERLLSNLKDLKDRL